MIQTKRGTQKLSPVIQRMRCSGWWQPCEFCRTFQNTHDVGESQHHRAAGKARQQRRGSSVQLYTARNQWWKINNRLLHIHRNILGHRYIPAIILYCITFSEVTTVYQFAHRQLTYGITTLQLCFTGKATGLQITCSVSSIMALYLYGHTWSLRPCVLRLASLEFSPQHTFHASLHHLLIQRRSTKLATSELFDMQRQWKYDC